MPVKKTVKPTTKKVEKSIIDEKFNKQEIIYSAIVEKELLHNGMVQREMLRTLKDLSKTMSDLTVVIQSVERHQFLEMHKKKWKMALYNLAMGMLFAIGTVFGLLLLSWSTYHFFKDSTALRNIVDKQLQLRNFNLGEIKENAIDEGKSTTSVQELFIGNTATGTKKDSK